MKTPLRLNPLSYFSLLLVAATGLCLAVLLTASFQAPRIGTLPPVFSFQEVYLSEPWTFEAGEYRFRLPENAVIAPVYNADTFIGFTFQAENGTVLSPASAGRERVSGGFLAMDNETFLQTKGKALFTPVPDRTLKNRLVLEARQLLVFPVVQAVVHPRLFLPDGERDYAYLENNGVIGTRDFSLLEENRPWLVTFFGLQFLLALLVTQLLTLDLSPPRPLAAALKTFPSGRDAAAAGAAILLLFLLHGYLGLSAAAFDAAFHPAALLAYLAVLLSLTLLSWRRVITRQSFGLTRKNTGRGFAVALFLALILTAFSALSLPRGLAVETPRAAASLFGLIFLLALARELFWRGFVQTLLERAAGRWGSLLLATLLASGFYLLLAWTQTPERLVDAAGQLELFFFLPGLTLLLGYVYLRSRNVLSSALLHALILFIAKTLIF